MLSLADPHELVDRVRRGVFTVRETIRPSEWAQRYRVVNRNTPRPGRWDNDLVPAARGVMDAYAEPGIRRVTLRKATQVFGTEVLINVLGYIIAEDPTPVLWAYPTDDRGRSINRKRVLPGLKDSPEIERHFTGRKHDENGLELFLDRMDVRFTGCGGQSEANLEGDPCGWVPVDETDRCIEQRHDVLEILDKRIENFARGQRWNIGTPGDALVGVDREYEGDEDYRGSDQRMFHVPCPHCGHYHARERFDQIKWDYEPFNELDGSGGPASARHEDVARHAWFECPLCGERIGAEHNLWQQRHGTWLRRGETIESDGRILEGEHEDCLSRFFFPDLRADTAARERAEREFGVVIHTNGVVGGEHAGFWVPGWYRTLDAFGNPYGSVAAPFVKNKCRATKNWVNRDCGEGWKESGADLGVELLRTIAETSEYDSLTFARERLLVGVPGWVLGITVCCDIQKDRVVVGVRGWGAHGAESGVLFVTEIPRDEGRRLTEIDELYDWTFCGAFDESTGELTRPVPVFGWGFDSGYDTEDVYRLVRRGRQRNLPVWPVKGVNSPKMVVPYAESALDKSKVRYARLVGMKLLNVNSYVMKSLFSNRVRGEELRLPGGEGFDDETGQFGSFSLARDLPDWYLKELGAEHRVRKTVGGVPTYVWELKPKRSDNHAFDVECYHEAIAAFRGVRMLGSGIRQSASGSREEKAGRGGRGDTGTRVGGTKKK